MEPAYLQGGSLPTATDPGAWGAHDPTVIRAQDGRWFMFSTDTRVSGGDGVGVQIRVSEDLVTWRWCGHAFDGVPEEAARWSGAPGLWAPEVIRRGGQYRMYYSASTFGSRTSAIGLATAPGAAGPWEHRRLVVTTRHEADPVNAIDAAVVSDHGGRDHLLYGSFFGGLRILPLDEDGVPVTEGDPGTPVVKRAASLDGAVEGGHIVPGPAGDFALICSFDSLFDTYNIRVARSAQVTGPYTDHCGRAMINDSEPPAQVGTVILMGYRAPDGQVWVAPGHSSHVTTPWGTMLVHHVRDGADPRRHTAQVRPLRFTRSGWPLASPLPWSGPLRGAPGPTGRYLLYRLDPTATIPLEPQPVDVKPGDMSDISPGNPGELRVAGMVLDAVLFVDAGGVAFAGLDEQGVVVWGIREPI